MREGTAKRQRLLIYLFVTWLLLWSLFRMLLYPQQLGSGLALSSARGLLIIAFTGILTIAWAIGGPLLLSNWHRLSGRIVNIADSPGRASSAIWLLPLMAWFLAYSLITVAWSINPAMVDGPVLVLALLGIVLLVTLVRHRLVATGQDDVMLTKAPQSRPGRLERYWSSLPEAVKYVLAVSLLGLIVLLWFREALFDAAVTVYGGDIWNQHYDLEAHASRLLKGGQIPFWNPYIYSGSPFSAHPQSLLFYPPQLILRVLPLNLSVSWSIALHVWIAGIGMLALALWKRLRFWIAFLCAMVYMLNGSLLLRIFAGHIWLAFALCWLPLVWLLVMVALNSGRPGHLIAAAVGTTMVILTGHPAFPIYILLFYAFYWLWTCLVTWRRKRSWRPVAGISGRFSAIMALAFGLSAIQIVPTLVMYSQVSLSEGYGAGGANFLAISLADLTALIMPNFYVTGHHLGHYWELVPYVGVLFILLLPFSYVARRTDWFRDYLSASAVASMAIAMGSSIGIYFVLYYLIPPFRVARIPPRSLVIFVPAVTLLGGMGLQTVVERAADARLFSLITRAYLFASVFILGITLGVWLGDNLLPGVQLSDAAALPVQLAIGALILLLVQVRLAGLIPAAGTRASDIVFALALSGVGVAVGILIMPRAQPVARQLIILSLLIAASALLLASAYRQGARPVVVVAFLLLVFFDLYCSGRLYIRAESPPVFYQSSRLALKDVDLQQFDRVLSYTDEPDQYMLGQVGNIDGYNSGILSGYEQFLRGLSGAGVTSSPRILLDGSLPDPRALAFLGARYILSDEPIENEAFRLINVRDNVYLYENPGALPRAYVVYDAVRATTAQEALALLRDPDFDYASQVVVEDGIPTGSPPGGEAAVDIVQYSEADGSMLVRVETSEPGLLVLSEPYYSERRVWLDGRETDMLQVNLGFIGVAVPAGTHDVELGYVPTSLYIGGGMTALSILAGVVALAVSSRRSARHKDDTA